MEWLLLKFNTDHPLCGVLCSGEKNLSLVAGASFVENLSSFTAFLHAFLSLETCF